MTTIQAPETPVEQQVEPKTARITLSSASGSSKLTLMAVRRPDGGATTFVIVTDENGKTSRGITANHASFDAAKATIEKEAVAAQKLGWSRRTTSRGFVARPDQFSAIPAPPTTKSAKKKS